MQAFVLGPPAHAFVLPREQLGWETRMVVMQLLAVVAAQAGSNVDLGKAAGACRPGEQGPAFVVEVAGLRDHVGFLKLEIYPANDDDFLADDSALVTAGKTFRRVEVPVPPVPMPRLCVRVPHAGPFAVSLLHDRDRDHLFDVSRDGIGFAGDPRLGWSKPKARSVTMVAGAGLTRLRIVMNYRHGLVMRPDR